MFAPGQRGREPRIGRPARLAQHVGDRCPVLVAAHGDGDPLVGAPARVAALHPGHVPVPLRRQAVAAGGRGDEHVAEALHQVLALRELDQLAGPGALPVPQRGEHAEHHAVDRDVVHVVGRARVLRRRARVTAQRRDPGQRLEVGTEAERVDVRPAEPERRHVDEDEPRVDRAEVGPGEAELLADRVRVVFHQHVADLDQPVECPAAFGGVQLHRRRPLALAGHQERRVPVVRVGAGFLARVGRPDAAALRDLVRVGVGHLPPAGRREMPDRLEPDDLGAERREQTAGRGPGPHHGDVDHADAAQWQVSHASSCG